jgi:hypothetical protein
VDAGIFGKQLLLGEEDGSKEIYFESVLNSDNICRNIPVDRCTSNVCSLIFVCYLRDSVVYVVGLRMRKFAAGLFLTSIQYLSANAALLLMIVMSQRLRFFDEVQT